MKTKQKIETLPELTPKQKEELLKYKPQLLAIHKEVMAARIELMGSDGAGISDFEFMQLIRLAYPSDDEGSYTDLLQRIEADHIALKRALADGEWKFFSRLGSLQKRQMRNRENLPA